eukprot:c24711_g1_i2 orf=327-1346(+)
MSIPGVECARRRRVYHGRPLDCSTSQVRTGGINSSVSQQQNHPRKFNDHLNSYRHRYYNYKNIHLHSRSDPASARPLMNISGSSIGIIAEEGNTGLTVGNGSSFSSLGERERLTGSRLPLLNRGYGVAMAARSRLDEKLRTGALVNCSSAALTRLQSSLRCAFGGDKSNSWDDTLVDIGMRDYVAASAFDSENRNLRLSSRNSQCFKPKEGLSRAEISGLYQESFTPNKAERASESKETISEQEVCPVCLDHFILSQTMICLPCNHRFHSDCLIPWLNSNRQCPYCRAEICDKEIKATTVGLCNHNSMQAGDELVSLMASIEMRFRRFGLHPVHLLSQS